MPNLSLPGGRVRAAKKAARGARRSTGAAAALRRHVPAARRIPLRQGRSAPAAAGRARPPQLAGGERGVARPTSSQTFVDEALQAEDLPLNEDERRRLVDDLLEETLGVGPLAPLMADPAVTDILVNRPDQVYVERFGRLEKTDVRFRDTRPSGADHPADRRPRRPADRRKLADGRRPAARRQPRQRHAAAGDARRPDAFHPPLRPPAAAARTT